MADIVKVVVKKKRGFAAMDPEKARAIQRKGGQLTSGNFKHDPERARLAGRKSRKNKKKG